MSQARPVGLFCTITRGGFSGERIFSLELASKKKHEGIAPREYCWTGDGKTVGLEEPEPERSIEGIVAAREYRRQDGLVHVSTPDGEAFWVLANQVGPRPASSSELAQNVPI